MSSGSSNLSVDQLAELRRELERELARLEHTLASGEEAARPVMLDQTSVGRVSRSDAMQNQQMSVELHQRNESRRAQILEALRRITQGRYGTCSRCGTAIPFGRLLVVPETTVCVRCGASA